ncbi:MAG TPA: hypothetical protein PKA78_01215 [Macellibacteroides fermentans]|uniref:LVIVD repeat-containing protein n=1 Tax=Macellibacteroides fermentans TaxID=879969 RepID=UPI002CD56E31|nr:hypothetical protein [Macellibacteroides fermentans]
MKRIYTHLFCLLSLLGMLSCTDKYTEIFTANEPVYMSYDELRSAVQISYSRAPKHPGKIYYYGSMIFIIEKMEGIHIINIGVPSYPTIEKFIEVPGCTDMVVRNQTIYVDSYVDLVTVDISDLMRIKETHRLKNVLPYKVPATDNEYPVTRIDQQKGVIREWKVITEKRELEPTYYPTYPMYDNLAHSNWSDNLSFGSATGSGVGGLGKSGSMSRFGMQDNYLYIADNNSLNIFDVSGPPLNVGKAYLNTNIETMFVYDKHLFFGTPSGMMIYSLQVPNTPAYVSTFWHATSCDPVVVQDGYAYITLRGGQVCHADFNRLDVVKLSADYKTNTLAASYNLTNPYGLAIENNTLFVCDGTAGLKVYDATDKLAISSHQLAAFPDIKTYDVIPVNGYLFMVGDDGFFLYDYRDLQHIKQIGRIVVNKE